MARLLPLTQIDAQQLQQAYAMLQAGDAVGAEAKARMVVQAKGAHADALHLLALTLSPQARLTEARDALEAALEAAPKHPHILNSYGNLLGDMGEVDAALRAFEQALRIDPHYVDALINFGITATTAGQLTAAIKALELATALDPNAARGWTALGLAHQQNQQLETAMVQYRRALALQPQDVRTWHNMATALRDGDEAGAALAAFDTALLAGAKHPETLCGRAHVLAELGRFDEAIVQYHDVMKAAPDYLDAHETLARLLPQLGQQDIALDSYHAALKAKPNEPLLWRSAISAARDMGDPAQMLRWAHAATDIIGAQLDFDLARVSALSMQDEHAAAKTDLLALLQQAPDHAGLHNSLTYTYLALGDAAAAQHHALRTTYLEPDNQSAWAYLTLIWRLLDDPREQWLANYEQLVMPIDVPLSDGVLAELEATLNGLHMLHAHPAEQSLRGGTQTRGSLFNKKAPVLQSLQNAIKTSAAQALAALPNDPTHPFLCRKTPAISFSGSWSVKLRSAGFHINHMHPMGWLSSAFYVALPPEIDHSAVGHSEAGALAFGAPDSALGLNLPPRRIIRPKVGRLVIFPSYLWHGTIPFESETPRLTVAFDARPT
jgi:tetratricopeptide (TPR) repeat protein